MEGWRRLQRFVAARVAARQAEVARGLSGQLPMRPFAESLPTHPQHQHVYVLPTLNGQLSFHARLAVPTSGTERAAIVAAYAMRTARLAAWESAVAAPWQRLGAHASAAPLLRSAHAALTRLGTRRTAPGEYLLRALPPRTARIEVIHPPCVEGRLARRTLALLLRDRQAHKRQLFVLSVLVAPPLLFVAKFAALSPALALAANAAFVYIAFRIVNAWRAMSSAARVQMLVDSGNVVFTASDAFGRSLQDACDKVSHDLQAQTIQQSTQQQPIQQVWHWNGGLEDLHDNVLAILEKDLKMYEWLRNYRRARMVAFVHYSNETNEQKHESFSTNTTLQTSTPSTTAATSPPK
ncbi:hypothetical protein HK100_003951 [Physocladia obscura]|uniref:Uncharacterized protein n=1 Tax=Physocladia obscura TaxID=109957 RepID=A0AAD5T6M3_9FUNG|nr:hypothetical protein HK100_003951 [Physocladia obscura]